MPGTNQSRAQTRQKTVHSTQNTTPDSRFRDGFLHKKSPRTLAFAAATVAALLAVSACGQDQSSSATGSDLSPVAETSNTPSQAPVPASETPAPAATTEPPAAPAAPPAPAPAPAPATMAPVLAQAAAPAPLAATGGAAPLGVAGNWTMAFNDDFNAPSLDGTKWSNCWFSSNCGTMNKVSTSPGNVAVAGGNLVLSLNSATSGALVSTNPKGGATTGYQFGTGYVEARIKFPGNANGLYNWPAFWTTGQSWPSTGENDIAEVLKAKMTVNYHSTSGAQNQGTVPGNWANDFHTYGLHRTATSSDVYFDGVKVKSYPTNDGNAPQYIVLNVGAASTNPTYGAASQVQVDYVRAWQ